MTYIERRIETIGAGLNYETGFIYDKNTGKILWEQRRGKYETLDTIPFLSTRKNIDSLIVHNHPPSFENGILKWSPISPEDVYNVLAFDCGGVIVNDGVNIYSFLRPVKGWKKVNTDNPRKFLEAWDKEYAVFDEIDREKVKNFKMSLEDYYQSGQFYRMNKVFRKLYGVSMTFTPIPQHSLKGKRTRAPAIRVNFRKMI